MGSPGRAHIRIDQGHPTVSAGVQIDGLRAPEGRVLSGCSGKRTGYAVAIDYSVAEVPKAKSCNRPMCLTDLMSNLCDKSVRFSTPDECVILGAAGRVRAVMIWGNITGQESAAHRVESVAQEPRAGRPR